MLDARLHMTSLGDIISMLHMHASGYLSWFNTHGNIPISQLGDKRSASSTTMRNCVVGLA